jgi:hypothetical protein
VYQRNRDKSIPLLQTSKIDLKISDSNDYQFDKTLRALQQAQKTSSDYRYVKKYQKQTNSLLTSKQKSQEYKLKTLYNPKQVLTTKQIESLSPL